MMTATTTTTTTTRRRWRRRRRRTSGAVRCWHAWRVEAIEPALPSPEPQPPEPLRPAASGAPDDDGRAAPPGPVATLQTNCCSCGAPAAGAPLGREENLCRDEYHGDLRFVLTGVAPAARAQRLALESASGLIQRQLPMMGHKHTAKLLLDASHRSLVCLARGEAVGALTFKTLRPNRWNGDDFAELAFCVVAQEMQVQGLGTRMMNQLKALLVGERVFRVLTYADNFAIGFFRQHGFSRPVTLPQDEWKGRIAEYEGGQMMEAILHADVPYAQLPDAIHAVRSPAVAAWAAHEGAHGAADAAGPAAPAAPPPPHILAGKGLGRWLAAVVEASGCELLQPGDRQGGGVGLSRRIAPKEPDAPSWHGSTELPKVVSAALTRRRVELGAAHAADGGDARTPPLPHRRRVARRRPRACNLAPLVLKGQVRAALKKCTPPRSFSDDDDDDDDAGLTEEAASRRPPPPRRQAAAVSRPSMRTTVTTTATTTTARRISREWPPPAARR